MNMIPNYLVGYDYLSYLNEWRDAKEEGIGNREWRIRTFRYGYICRLSWEGNGRNPYHLEQAARSVEEAVYQALEEFTKFTR